MFKKGNLKNISISILKFIKWFVLLSILIVFTLSYYFESDKFFEEITLKNNYECNQKNLVKVYLEDKKAEVGDNQIKEMTKSMAFTDIPLQNKDYWSDDVYEKWLDGQKKLNIKKGDGYITTRLKYFSNGLNLIDFKKFYNTERCLNTKKYAYFKPDKIEINENKAISYFYIRYEWSELSGDFFEKNNFDPNVRVFFEKNEGEWKVVYVESYNSYTQKWSGYYSGIRR